MGSYVLHASQTLCAAHKLYFVCCMRAILSVLCTSKKHMSQTSCAAHESVFSCAVCKLTAIVCQKRTKAYNEMAYAYKQT